MKNDYPTLSEEWVLSALSNMPKMFQIGSVDITQGMIGFLAKRLKCEQCK